MKKNQKMRRQSCTHTLTMCEWHTVNCQLSCSTQTLTLSRISEQYCISLLSPSSSHSVIYSLSLTGEGLLNYLSPFDVPLSAYLLYSVLLPLPVLLATIKLCLQPRSMLLPSILVEHCAIVINGRKCLIIDIIVTISLNRWRRWVLKS